MAEFVCEMAGWDIWKSDCPFWARCVNVVSSCPSAGPAATTMAPTAPPTIRRREIGLPCSFSSICLCSNSEPSDRRSSASDRFQRAFSGGVIARIAALRVASWRLNVASAKEHIQTSVHAGRIANALIRARHSGRRSSQRVGRFQATKRPSFSSLQTNGPKGKLVPHGLGGDASLLRQSPTISGKYERNVHFPFRPRCERKA